MLRFYSDKHFKKIYKTTGKIDEISTFLNKNNVASINHAIEFIDHYAFPTAEDIKIADEGKQTEQAG